MAVYRQIYPSFWTDPKVEDDFTPEDKYFYLYLLTNQHTSICGCYELSYRQMSRETGYNEDTAKRLLQRMQNVHRVLCYDEQTKEVLILNWYKYNWTRSDKFLTGIRKTVEYIKTPSFKEYVVGLLNGDTVSIPYVTGMDTSVSVTVTGSVSESVSVSASAKPQKHKYGYYGHVLLTDDELAKLQERFPTDWEDRIGRLDEGIELKGYKYKNHYLAILKWAESSKPTKNANRVMDELNRIYDDAVRSGE